MWEEPAGQSRDGPMRGRGAVTSRGGCYRALRRPLRAPARGSAGAERDPRTGGSERGGASLLPRDNAAFGSPRSLSALTNAPA